jgi:membrane protease YdiL (CAAX protease family)
MRDALALTWAMIFPSVMTWGYFVAAPGLGAGPSLAMTVYVVGKILQFAFPAVFVGLTDRQSLRPAWPSRQGLTAGLAFGLVVGLAAMELYHGWLKDSSLLQGRPDKVYAKLKDMHCASTVRFLAVAVFYSVFHSLLEEYFWRWFVFGWLKRHLRLWPALMLASLAFMAHHVIVLAVYFPGVKKFFTLALPLSLGVAIGGGVWCWLYHKTGSLYAAWISHMLIDAAIMGIGYDLVADRFESAP